MILSFVSGFRYDVGTDFLGYISYFNMIENGIDIPVEKGFVFLNVLISKMGLNSQALFLVMSILTMFFFINGMKYYSTIIHFYKPLVYVAFLIFIYFSSFNGIRQSLAAAILFYASRYIIEKRLILFGMWTLIAMQFHFSSILFLLLFFVVGKSYSKKIMLIVLLASFMLVKLNMVSEILIYINNNLSYLDVGGYLSNYLYDGYNLRDVSYGIVFYINILIISMFIIMKNNIIDNRTELIVFNLFYIYNLIGILSMDVPALTRLMLYFPIYMVICIPLIIKIVDDKIRPLFKYIMTTLYILLYLFIIINGYINSGQSDFIPYKFNIDIFS
ncbi:EpsG family protein [Sporosarcina ureae]|nr:EpsG family protein [Sporosarcina ureae]